MVFLCIFHMVESPCKIVGASFASSIFAGQMPEDVCLTMLFIDRKSCQD
jgi:hypothetical protein